MKKDRDDQIQIHKNDVGGKKKVILFILISNFSWSG